jgi:nitrite reductase (NAD(P)H)
MGVDVASFGDYFADIKQSSNTSPLTPPDSPPKPALEVEVQTPKPSKRTKKSSGPVKCLTYHDPIGGTYKKYIFSEDGQHLVGGMMIGDVGDFTKLVAITKKTVRSIVDHADVRRKS